MCNKPLEIDEQITYMTCWARDQRIWEKYLISKIVIFVAHVI